jgi:hypothetical protein
MQGALPDRAALQGLLARLEMFGVQVLEVRQDGDALSAN